MKTRIKLTRPDKIILDGLRIISPIPSSLYSRQKSDVKAKAQIQLIGTKKLDQVQSQLFRYDLSSCELKEDIRDFGFLNTLDENDIYWLNFHGLHEIPLFENLSKVLNLDRLTLRQIPDTTQRSKVEEYEHYLYFSIKSILKDQNHKIVVEQLSFILGKNYVISFQEEKGDHFDHIRNKLEEDLGLLRKKGSDYLLYQLLDAILDNYFETIDIINGELSLLENETLNDPSQKTLLALEGSKKSSELIKKTLVPIRDAIKNILNGKTTFIDKENRKYFTDLLSNCLSAMEEIDGVSKSLEGLTNIYFSSLSNRMNETMKVLTTVATIFIPLTFIAGIYGMNFEYMPELSYRNGYFYALGSMGLVFAIMVIYFKTRKWL